MADLKIWASVSLALTPEEKRKGLGVTSTELKEGQAVGVEFFITFILAFTVAASCDRTRNDLAGSAPLTIGLTVTACHLFAIYWLGPILGAVTAMFLYETLFVADHSKDEPFGQMREGATGGVKGGGKDSAPSFMPVIKRKKGDKGAPDKQETDKQETDKQETDKQETDKQEKEKSQGDEQTK